ILATEQGLEVGNGCVLYFEPSIEGAGSDELSLVQAGAQLQIDARIATPQVSAGKRQEVLRKPELRGGGVELDPSFGARWTARLRARQGRQGQAEPGALDSAVNVRRSQVPGHAAGKRCFACKPGGQAVAGRERGDERRDVSQIAGAQRNLQPGIASGKRSGGGQMQRGTGQLQAVHVEQTRGKGISAARIPGNWQRMWVCVVRRRLKLHVEARQRGGGRVRPRDLDGA